MIQRKNERIYTFLLLFSCLTWAAAFQLSSRTICATQTQHVQSNKNGFTFTLLHGSPSNDDDPSSPASAIYKDDCFGFTSFLAGFAVQDYIFTGIFVSLSVVADIMTRQRLLPPDPKRPDIVDRRVPGVIAALTLLASPVVADVLAGNTSLGIDLIRTDLARSIQLAICSFSIITAFLDIRWRDRFDYPPEDQV